jgi:hypothetical protein
MNNKWIAVFLFFEIVLQSGAALAQTQNYFQQRVDHKIEVSLDDKQHFLRGHSTISYTNNSSDTLQFIYMHLHPNAYSADYTAFSKQQVENGQKSFYEASKSDWGYIDSLNFHQEDMPAKIVRTNDLDVVKVLLPHALNPGATTVITTPFRVKIPKMFSRLGRQGKSYQICQWFPKPAVFDKDGWHPMPYLDQGEFYDEIGSYDVTITLPKDYMVMATGNLLTESEIYWLEEKAKDAVGNGFEVPEAKAVTASGEFKTLRFVEDNVHDFAWFADQQWILRKDTVLVPKTNDIVTIYVAYHPENNKSWASSVDAVKKTINFYSNKVGPYPYKTVKVVEGALSAGGGMEYPTVTVIAPGMGQQNDLVIGHEVGHNWFQGILASNERTQPWLDEGVNSYYEQQHFAQDSAAPGIAKMFKSLEQRFFAIGMARRKSQAIGLSSEVFEAGNYGADVYNKSAAYLKWLEAYMGESAFDAAMQEYYDTWKFKHPMASDFELVFRKHTSKNLDWFFQDALNSALPVDFAIKGRSRQPDGTNLVTVKNKTGFLGPVALQGDASQRLYWSEPFRGTTQIKVDTPFEKIRIAPFIADYNRANDIKPRQFGIKGLVNVNEYNAHSVSIAPALAYNAYDRFMLGILFHNFQLPERSFQYAIAPMYAFGANSLVGTGMISKAIYPKQGAFNEIDLNLNAKRFSYRRAFINAIESEKQQYLKIAPELRLFFRPSAARSPIQQYLSLRAYYIQEGIFDYQINPQDSSRFIASKSGYVEKFYGKVRFQHNNKRTYNPYDFGLEAQFGSNFAKLSVEANLKVDYFYKDKGIHFRFFGGKLIPVNAAVQDIARYSLAGTYSGWNDYLYDETFFARNYQTSFGAQQIYIREGGMKMPTLQYANQVGLANNWLAAFNVNIDLPIGLPVSLFADFMTLADARAVNPAGSKWLYDAGIAVKILKFADVYFPLLMSREYKDYTNSVLGKGAFWKSITFKFDLDKIYWARVNRQLF